MAKLFANSGDSDQTPHSAASDLGLHCLPVTLYGSPDYNGLILFQLTVLQGDLVKVTADAIVHPTSNSFYMGGEVGQALQKAGGKDFQQEVKALHTSHGDLDTSSGEILNFLWNRIPLLQSSRQGFRKGSF